MHHLLPFVINSWIRPWIHPEKSASDYYNRKGYYSIIVQSMVDFRGLFMDVYIGWPGKVHDARVFVNLSLYKRGRRSTLLPDWKRNICGVEVWSCKLYMWLSWSQNIYSLKVPLVILGDPAYPSFPSTTDKSRARMVVENAFGRLKGLCFIVPFTKIGL